MCWMTIYLWYNILNSSIDYRSCIIAMAATLGLVSLWITFISEPVTRIILEYVIIHTIEQSTAFHWLLLHGRVVYLLSIQELCTVGWCLCQKGCTISTHNYLKLIAVGSSLQAVLYKQKAAISIFWKSNCICMAERATAAVSGDWPHDQWGSCTLIWNYNALNPANLSLQLAIDLMGGDHLMF